MSATQSINTIDELEVAKFETMSAEWWDPTGKLTPLHMLSPTRLEYIVAQIAAKFGRDRKSIRIYTAYHSLLLLPALRQNSSLECHLTAELLYF
jgi:2-polyprenyl-3-methyl-5-hydroxy-6-metoxy-1,4-benzoquinol methylase